MRYFEIHPKRPIPNILPNHKRIDTVMKLPLSRNEFLRCMQYATLYAIVGDEKILVTETNYDKAMELFSKEVTLTTKTIKLEDRSSIKENLKRSQSNMKQIRNSLPKIDHHTVPKSDEVLKVNLVKEEKPNKDLSGMVPIEPDNSKKGKNNQVAFSSKGMKNVKNK